jgi:hypothetical protein
MRTYIKVASLQRPNTLSFIGPGYRKYFPFVESVLRNNRGMTYWRDNCECGVKTETGEGAATMQEVRGVN